MKTLLVITAVLFRFVGKRNDLQVSKERLGDEVFLYIQYLSRAAFKVYLNPEALANDIFCAKCTNYFTQEILTNISMLKDTHARDFQSLLNNFFAFFNH
jgi:hypothetical protein